MLGILKRIARRFLGILLDNQGQRERAVPRLEEFRPPGTRGKLTSECGSQGDSRAASATQCLEGRRKGRGTLATHSEGATEVTSSRDQLQTLQACEMRAPDRQIQVFLWAQEKNRSSL